MTKKGRQIFRGK